LVSIAAVSTFAAVALHGALVKTQDAERQARLREAEALVSQAHGTRYSRRPGQRFDALAALAKAAAIGHELGQPAAWFDGPRNEAIGALALPDIHITQSWNGFPPGTHAADVSQDFQLYARTTERGACSVRRIADDVELAQLPELGEPALAAFGPGLLLVLYGESTHRLQLWDLAGPEPILRLNQRRPHHDWNFRADGRLIALGNPDGSFEVLATDTGKLRHHLDARGITQNANPCLHPTEPVAAICSYESRLLQIRDLGTGAVHCTLALPWRGSAGGAWSPDGRILAVAGGDSDVIHLYAFDPAARTLRLTRVLLRQPVGGGLAVRFNAAGDRFVAHGWSGKVHLFDVNTGRLLFSTHSLLSTGLKELHLDPTGERLAPARVGPRQDQIGLWSVADAREYRALVHDGPEQGNPHLGWPAVHPGGRLAAQAFNDGLALFDLETGRELAFVAPHRGVGCVCFDDAGNLLTNAFEGVFRWPVRPDPARPGRLTVGPAERLPFNPGDRAIAASRDGQVIAQAMYAGYRMQQYAGGWILHPNAPKPRRVDAGTSMAWAGVSPDGRWAAFGQHNTRVNVYEAATGRRVWQSPADNHADCRFSPDGRWLVTDNDGGRAYAVGTWQPGPSLGPGRPWDVSPDSRLVVMGQMDGVYRLVELATGRELAQLEDPEQANGSAVFTPEGTRLVVAAKDGLRIWDLRRIRAELNKLGLDWDAPAYPPAPPAVAAPPLTVYFDQGNLAALVQPRQAVGVYSLALALCPLNAEAYLYRGRAYAQLNQPGNAIADYTVFLTLAPPNDKRRPEALNGLAQACRDRAWQLMTKRARP
jgi:WD40 repeat protein